MDDSEVKGGYDEKGQWVGPVSEEVAHWRRRALAAEKALGSNKWGKPMHSHVVQPAGPNVKRDG